MPDVPRSTSPSSGARRCPRCGATFAPPARFCQNDGSPLLEAPGRPAVSGTHPGSSQSRTDVRHSPTPAQTDPAGTLTNQVLDGRYQIRRKLGEGGMSYVYEAREVDSGQSIAIKVLSPRLAGDQNSVERLRREAGLAMRLEHPNVCRILRLGETEDGLIYLVMPYLAGELLSDLEARVGQVEVSLGVALLIQMARGLQHAHELQIIHRDLKPENVMLVKDESLPTGLRAVVMDFGLAKERRAGPDVAKLTATGIVLGTPEFMSPEQIRGKPLDARSDVYALAILAYEMFTTRLPFQGRTAQETMIARLRGTPAPMKQTRPDLPVALETVIMRGLEADPARRWGSMGEFAKALSDLEGGKTMFSRIFGR